MRSFILALTILSATSQAYANAGYLLNGSQVGEVTAIELAPGMLTLNGSIGVCMVPVQMIAQMGLSTIDFVREVKTGTLNHVRISCTTGAHQTASSIALMYEK